MKRGSNYHNGRTRSIPVEPHTKELLDEVVKKSGRCYIDVVKLALRHYNYRPNYYKNIKDRKNTIPRNPEIELRLTRAMYEAVMDAAWQADCRPGIWLGNLIAYFLHCSDIQKLIYVLRNGIDLLSIMETDDGFRQADARNPNIGDTGRAESANYPTGSSRWVDDQLQNNPISGSTWQSERDVILRGGHQPNIDKTNLPR